MPTRADPQLSYFDKVIENEEIEKLLESHEAFKEAARRYGKAHRALKGALDGLEHGIRYRIGRFVVTPAPIAGGGFKIDKWTSTAYGVGALD